MQELLQLRQGFRQVMRYKDGNDKSIHIFREFSFYNQFHLGTDDEDCIQKKWRKKYGHSDTEERMTVDII